VGVTDLEEAGSEGIVQKSFQAEAVLYVIHLWRGAGAKGSRI
jgi:hypothetical protein